MKTKLPATLSVLFMLGPILDVLTALTVTAGMPISIGVICRSLLMVTAFVYVVVLAKFPTKRVCVGILSVICGYMALFMAHLYLIGGLPLCLANVQESAKTFYAPIIAVFLYAVYQEYGQPLTTKSIAIAGGLYTNVILVAYLTGTSFVSYSDSGYGYCGWFFAANEVGCIISISAPITIYYILTILPTLDKWWKKILAAWTLFSIVFSACFVGTKVVYIFVLLYCLAALVWMIISSHYKRSSPWSIYRKISTGILGAMVLFMVGAYVISPLAAYFENVYTEIMKEDSILRAISANEEIEADSADTWMRYLLENNEVINKLDQILSRRLYAASPSIQVYIDGDTPTHLFGIGYATASSYGRNVDYMIEMDLLSVLIRHGVVGFALYIVPYITFIGWGIIHFFVHIRVRIKNYRHCTHLFSVLAAFAIALIAGHALVSPAVATFSVAVSINFWAGVRDAKPAFCELVFSSKDIKSSCMQRGGSGILRHKTQFSI